MTSPLERAAKAAYGRAGIFRWESWEQAEPALRAYHIKNTRAALESLREPTDEMLAAGGETSALQLVAKGIWQAMMTKILER